MNLAVRELQENMIEVINSAQLPTEVKRLVVCDILYKLEMQANKEIAYEIQKNQANTKEE